MAEKLDRFFIKGESYINNLNILSPILPILGSDHFPVRIDISEPEKLAKISFKCEKMWFLDSNFIENIKIWWS